MLKPSVFIGCSAEGLNIARAVELQLHHDAEITIYNEGFFAPGGGTLETLISSLDEFDFAVLVLTPDDVVVSRDVPSRGPRDNVMFELGLFMGRLGRLRTFIVYDSDQEIKLASDLAGITPASYKGNRKDNNLTAAVGPACTLIRNAMQKLGVAETNSSKQLEKATDQVENVSTTVARLVHLLAKSRVVELDVIASQFGGLIPTEALEKIQGDLKSLEEATDVSPYFIGNVFSDLQPALKAAQSRSQPVFMIVFDEDKADKSQLARSLGAFMKQEPTRRLVHKHFVQLLISSKSVGIVPLLPKGDTLENCLLTVLTPKGNVFLQETVYANPDEGYSRVRKFIEQWRMSEEPTSGN